MPHFLIKINIMKSFLNSKWVSLACAGINAFFAYNALINESWIWFAICTGLSAYCLNNYRKG